VLLFTPMEENVEKDVYNLSALETFIPFERQCDYDSDTTTTHKYITVSSTQVNKKELGRLYKDHPWVWFDFYPTEKLRLTCDWDTDSEDEDCYHMFSNSFGDLVLDETNGLEGIVVRADQPTRRLILEDFMPFLE